MTTPPPVGRPKILLLGDSLTQTSFEGWGASLANTYQRRADIINRGMSGYNTRWYLRYAQDHGIWTEGDNHNVVLIILFFGANDASLSTENPHAHVPLDEYSSNLSQLVTLCKTNYTNAKIICITPPPVHHQQRLQFQIDRFGSSNATGRLERTLENTRNYVKACIIVSEQYRLPCLDLYHSMLLEEESSSTSTSNNDKEKKEEQDHHGKYFWDGLHFSKEGHDFVIHALLELIEKELPEFHVSKDIPTGQWNNSGTSCHGIQSSGPYHDHIDHTCFEQAFEKDNNNNNKTEEKDGVENTDKKEKEDADADDKNHKEEDDDFKEPDLKRSRQEE